jgi:hypothetical protein
VAIGPDPDITAAIRLEFVDPQGEGFAVLLDCNEALNLVLRVTGCLARMRGWATSGEDLQ